MRHFPREIEADLFFRGVDVFDWHRGLMSSRRLLALIEALPDDSSFRREFRDQDWSSEQYLFAAVVNELRLLRADQAAIHAQHDMQVNLVESPSQLAESEALAEKARMVREHVVSQMNGMS
jgi:hypothetical protein